MPQFGHVEAVVCCFCGLPKQVGGHLIAGPRIYICGDCIELAGDVIDTGTPMPTPSAMIQAMPAGLDEFRCSFCGKYRRDVDGIAGADQVDGMEAAGEVGICVECLQRCREVIAETPA